jgi:hypothetical protein
MDGTRKFEEALARSIPPGHAADVLSPGPAMLSLAEYRPLPVPSDILPESLKTIMSVAREPTCR